MVFVIQGYKYVRVFLLGISVNEHRSDALDRTSASDQGVQHVVRLCRLLMQRDGAEQVVCTMAQTAPC